MEDKLYQYLSLYYRLPQGLKNVLGGTYKRLPLRMRYGKSYDAFRRLIDTSCQWTEKEIDEYQWRRVESNVRHAYAHVPYYRKAFERHGLHPRTIQNFDDFKKIPCLTKSDLRRHYPDLIAQNTPKSKLLPITTGGTTGTPLTVCYEKQVSRPKEAAFTNDFWHRIGRLANDRIVFIRGNVIPDAEKNNYSLFDPIQNRLMMSSFHLTEKNLPAYIEAINRFSPDYLHVYPSSLTPLARYMDDRGIELNTPPKAILASSEKLYPWQAELFQKVFKCNLYGLYGLVEMAAFATDSGYDTGYRFSPAYSYVEFEKTTADAWRTGEDVYQVIGTTFHNGVMPLLRYRTEDVAVGRPTPCRCGHGGLMVKDIAGRQQEFFVDGQGWPITFIYADVPLWQIKNRLGAYQYVQAEKGRVLLRIEAQDRLKSADISRLQEAFNRVYPALAIEIEQVEKIERTQRGKFRYLIQEIPLELN